MAREEPKLIIFAGFLCSLIFFFATIVRTTLYPSAPLRIQRVLTLPMYQALGNLKRSEEVGWLERASWLFISILSFSLCSASFCVF